MSYETLLQHATPSHIFDSIADATGNSYDADIEEASDDQLRSWLIGKGVTNEELELRDLEGISLRDSCEEMIRHGYTFSHI